MEKEKFIDVIGARGEMVVAADGGGRTSVSHIAYLPWRPATSRAGWVDRHGGWERNWERGLSAQYILGELRDKIGRDRFLPTSFLRSLEVYEVENGDAKVVFTFYQGLVALWHHENTICVRKSVYAKYVEVMNMGNCNIFLESCRFSNDTLIYIQPWI